MIISASRRTDIPAWYFPWFLNRLEAGYALTRNPMNPRRISRVPLTLDQVDCIVFWSKNPAPMLPCLSKLTPYPFYVQFTLNPYGPEMETGLPQKAALLDTFRRLADMTSPEQVVWRYSPILLNQRYAEARHLEWFDAMCRRLEGYTRQCRLSFLDIYAKIRKTMRSLNIQETAVPQKIALARQLEELAASRGIRVSACGEPDLIEAGIPAARCIDPELVEKITGAPVALKKDPGQRTQCRCAPSVDIGAYSSCLNGCRYCYANHSPETARRGHAAHDPHGELLIGHPQPGDIITPCGKMRPLPRQGSLC